MEKRMEKRMARLHEIQSAFMNDLYTGSNHSASFLKTSLNGRLHNGMARLQIYRNNNIVTLTDLLIATYPVIAEIVGADFFKTLCYHYIETYPAHSGNRNLFGHQLSAFVKNFKHTQELPYLPDVAAIEWAYFYAHIAPLTTKPPVPNQTKAPNKFLNFSQLTQQLETEPNLVLSLNQSLTLLELNYNGFALWQAHYQKNWQGVEPTQQPNKHAVWRGPDNKIEIMELSPDIFYLIKSCQTGLSFSRIMTDLQTDDKDLSVLQQEFANAVQLGVFVP